jgi:hypothetical protein
MARRMGATDPDQRESCAGWASRSGAEEYGLYTDARIINHDDLAGPADSRCW